RPKPTQHNVGELYATHRAAPQPASSLRERLAAYNLHYVLRPRWSASLGVAHKAAPSAVSTGASPRQKPVFFFSCHAVVRQTTL
ncbi:hypothetical protein KKJ07_19550, partial [Xenorhabdus bovienii]|nr:hypothetical protein [Xenorhabdus bovienii]